MTNMEKDPKTSVPSLGDRTNHFLPRDSTNTLEVHENPSSRGRSSSLSPSLRSFRSGTTEVDINPDLALAHKERKIKRITTDVEIQLSVWDCVKGIFSLGKRARTVTATVEVTNDGDDSESDGYDIETPSSFIKTVSVLSNEKDHYGRFINKEARCLFDTGNHQGNTVSRDFVLNHLNFPESEFIGKGLKKSEEEGISATGDKVKPDGVIYLDWYHANSIQRYRRMRFLVSPNSPCELSVGARSIEKHHILSPPNLANVVVTRRDLDTDAKREKLRSDAAELENDILSFKKPIKDARKAKNDVEVKTLQMQMEAKQKEYNVAKLFLDLYDAKLQLEKEPTKEDRLDHVEDLEQKLIDAKKQLPKEHPQHPRHSAPQVTITDFNGATRRPTGFSTRTIRTSGPTRAKK